MMLLIGGRFLPFDMDLTQLPTTSIGLIGFLTVANLGAMGYIVRYFLNAQKTQTKIYMEYISQKNGNLERVTENFNHALEEHRNRFETMLSDQGNRHKQMMDDASARLESCQLSKLRKKK